MPTLEIFEDCILEWHKERGVLYVHNKSTGTTLLRICGLENKSSLFKGMIDITRPERVTYPS